MMSIVSNVRRRSIGVAVGFIGSIVILGACSNGPGAGPDVIDRADPSIDSSVTSESSARTGGQAASADPVELVDAAGLALPASATDVTAVEQPLEPYTDRYLVSFTAPASDVAGMCLDAGLAGPLVAAVLSPDEKAIFQTDTAPEGAKICSGSSPGDGQQQRLVLYVGDPAQVQVGIWRMPPR